MDVSRLCEIEDLLIDDRTKGIPGGVAPFRLGDIGSQSWNLLHEDLPLPVAILKASALAHNGKWMASFLELSGAVISPHGKTTMSPQLFERQLDDGAWAVTVATVHQIQVCRHYGFSRIVLANQLVGRQAIRFVLDELRDDPDFDFYCLVDSVDGVEVLAAAARAHPVDRPVKVLLEGGMPGGRTGCRNLDAALAVARAAKAAAPHVALHGVEGFEGLIQADSLAEQEAKVAAFLDFLAEIAMVCQGDNLFAEGPIVLSAGGSAFYDMVLDRFRRIDLGRETMLLTRSGCYLSTIRPCTAVTLSACGSGQSGPVTWAKGCVRLCNFGLTCNRGRSRKRSSSPWAGGTSLSTPTCQCPSCGFVPGLMPPP